MSSWAPTRSAIAVKPAWFPSAGASVDGAIKAVKVVLIAKALRGTVLVVCLHFAVVKLKNAVFESFDF